MKKMYSRWHKWFCVVSTESCTGKKCKLLWRFHHKAFWLIPGSIEKCLIKFEGDLEMLSYNSNDFRSCDCTTWSRLQATCNSISYFKLKHYTVDNGSYWHIISTSYFYKFNYYYYHGWLTFMYFDNCNSLIYRYLLIIINPW